MTDPEFSLDQPLPPANTITVLEASAGTGKTFALAGLLARYVAEGHELTSLLAVTFSRLATAELRDKVRSRLIASRDALIACELGEPVGSDVIDRYLTTTDADTRRVRLARFNRALNQLDDAPLVTLHTFAARMLDELGLLADHDPGIKLQTDLQALADEVIADVYLADQPGSHQLGGWQSAYQLGAAAIEHFFEPLYPTDDLRAQARVGFAARVRAEYDSRKRARRLMGYDDMIGRLAATLRDPRTGPLAAEVLSARFRLVLVDEFQDTDAEQWEFLRLAFAHRSTMVLIGDPKQAIYRFRGGDIETYTRAKQLADHSLRLATNYRSDAAVVRGVAGLFKDVDLGTSSAPIPVTAVRARDNEPRLRYRDQPVAAAVRIRALDADERTWVSTLRQTIMRDLLAVIEELTAGEHQLAVDGGWRPLAAGDIAVLVNDRYFGGELHALLTAAGQPAVFTGEASVYASAAAADWLRLLEALESPDRWHLRRAMFTSLLGWDSAQIAAADEQAMVDMTALLLRCARLAADHGIAAVFETLVAERELYPRLLGQCGGEALLTDLRHLASLLNETQRAGRLSVAGLTEQLRRVRARALVRVDERIRRLPTDRPSIKIMTVHQAKGLQFPVVLVPQAGDRRLDDSRRETPLLGHIDGRRVLDVATPAARAQRYASYQAEELAESLRACYVACTRAQSLLVCWWAGSGKYTIGSPLHRLLHSSADGRAPEPTYPIRSAAELPAHDGVEITVISAPPPAPISAAASRAGQPVPHGLLAAREFSDHIDRDWVRTSYTGLTTSVHATASAQSAPESDEVVLDADNAAAAGSIAELLPGQASALAAQPGGTQFGSLVHEILEHVDPAAPDVTELLLAATEEAASRYPLPDLEVAAVAEGLWQTITTPLGELTSGRTLRDLGAAGRLTELDFELPLGGEDGRGRLGDLARLFRDLLPADDPLKPYGDVLASSVAADQVLAGFLTGSIDVVLRVPDDPVRYLVVDYKTNRMPVPADTPLQAQHYSPAAMTSAMIEAHYPLQALLYSVALHRYLGWRLPGYRPEVNLGGVGYLFVRGMVGADNPQLGSMPAGVFSWRPPAELVIAADAVLLGGATDAS